MYSEDVKFTGQRIICIKFWCPFFSYLKISIKWYGCHFEIPVRVKGYNLIMVLKIPFQLRNRRFFHATSKFPASTGKLSCLRPEGRGGGGVEGSKNLIFWFFVVNTSRGGSCLTKISNQRDCLDPKNEVYIFHWNITLKLNIEIWRLSKATHVSLWVSLIQ